VVDDSAPHMMSEKKTAIVTGASSGIGKATAIALAEKGWNLVLAARRPHELEDTAALCRAQGAGCLSVPADVSNADQCSSLVEKALAEFGAVHLLVNNAGFAIFDSISEASTTNLTDMMNTNYFGTVYCVKAVLPHMIGNRRGAIVNIGSISGIMGFAGMGGYSASKFALAGFTEALRDELKDSGVTVSLICPGTTNTPFFNIAEKGKMPHANRLILAISPERVARAVLRAEQRGSYRIILPVTAAVFMKMKELLPRTSHFLMRTVSNLFVRSRH